MTVIEIDTKKKRVREREEAETEEEEEEEEEINIERKRRRYCLSRPLSPLSPEGQGEERSGTVLRKNSSERGKVFRQKKKLEEYFIQDQFQECLRWLENYQPNLLEDFLPLAQPPSKSLPQYNFKNFEKLIEQNSSLITNEYKMEWISLTLKSDKKKWIKKVREKENRRLRKEYEDQLIHAIHLLSYIQKVYFESPDEFDILVALVLIFGPDSLKMGAQF
jgi:hypothetical protein